MDGIEICDERFRAMVLPNAPLEILGRAIAGSKDRYGSPTMTAFMSAIFRTIASCAGARRAVSRSSASPRASPTAMPATGRGASSVARTATAASCAPSSTARRRCSPATIAASGSIRPTISSANPTARSGSVIRTTASTPIMRAASSRRSCRQRSTGSILPPASWRSWRTISRDPTASPSHRMRASSTSRRAGGSSIPIRGSTSAASTWTATTG